MCDTGLDGADSGGGCDCFDVETDCINLLVKGGLCVTESQRPDADSRPIGARFWNGANYSRNSCKALCLSFLIVLGFFFTIIDAVMEALSLHAALNTQRINTTDSIGTTVSIYDVYGIYSRNTITYEEVDPRHARLWLNLYVLFIIICIPTEGLLVWYYHFGLLPLLNAIFKCRRRNPIPPGVDIEAADRPTDEKCISYDRPAEGSDEISQDDTDGEAKENLDGGEMERALVDKTKKASDDEMEGESSDDSAGEVSDDGAQGAPASKTKTVFQGTPRTAASGGNSGNLGDDEIEQISDDEVANNSDNVGVNGVYSSNGAMASSQPLCACAGRVSDRQIEVLIQTTLAIKSIIVALMAYGQLVFAISTKGNYLLFQDDLNQVTTGFLFATSITGYLINYFHLYRATVTRRHHSARNFFFMLEFLLAGFSLTGSAMSFIIASGGTLVLTDSPKQLFGSMVLWSIISYIIAFLLLTRIGRQILLAVLACICNILYAACSERPQGRRY